jgi:hypothetical protein
VAEEQPAASEEEAAKAASSSSLATFEVLEAGPTEPELVVMVDGYDHAAPALLEGVGLPIGATSELERIDRHVGEKLGAARATQQAAVGVQSHVLGATAPAAGI